MWQFQRQIHYLSEKSNYTLLLQQCDNYQNISWFYELLKTKAEHLPTDISNTFFEVNKDKFVCSFVPFIPLHFQLFNWVVLLLFSH